MADNVSREHFFDDLGFVISRGREGELLGTVDVVPEMHVPGTGVLRISVLAVLIDGLMGLLAVDVMTPRVPVTLMLEVHLSTPPKGVHSVQLTARTIKAGRSIFAAEVSMADERGRPLGFATGTFMVSPDPSVVFGPGPGPLDRLPEIRGRLSQPFAERMGIVLRSAGVAELPRRVESLNGGGTVNGGLLALVAEEAALSGRPGTSLATMSLHFMSPVRVGPAVAVAAQPGGSLAQVTVRDEGRGNTLAVVVTTREFP